MQKMSATPAYRFRPYVQHLRGSGRARLSVRGTTGGGAHACAQRMAQPLGSSVHAVVVATCNSGSRWRYQLGNWVTRTSAWTKERGEVVASSPRKNVAVHCLQTYMWQRRREVGGSSEKGRHHPWVSMDLVER